MKTLLPYSIILIFFFACNEKKYIVKKVIVDASTQNKTYYNVDNATTNVISILDDKKVAREGVNIDIIVRNFNPLSQTVSVNPVQSNYFYSNQSSLLTSFFPATPATPSTGGAGGTAVQNLQSIMGVGSSARVSRAARSTNCTTDPLYKAVREYLDFKRKVDDAYKNKFNCFYRQMTSLNAQYNELKLNKTLTSACVCSYLTNFSGLINPLLQVDAIGQAPDCVIPKADCPADKDACANSITTSTELLNANQSYKQYFSDAADSLIRLQTKQITLLKNSRYNDLNAFISRNLNCNEADAGVLAELTDKKFTSDLIKDISVYQAVNKTYADQYDKAITEIVSEYTILSHLTYEYVQKDIPVENTDEFKANIVIANSTKPEARPISVTLLVNRALKIDFSAGIFYSSLSNEASELKKKPGADSTTVNIIKSNNFLLGPMGYINFHSQYRGDINWGGYLGSGLAFNQSTKLVIAGGGSFLYGKYQRAILHFGVAAAQVDRVSSIYNKGSYFASSSGYTPTILQKWDTKIMIGISWNLSRAQ